MTLRCAFDEPPLGGAFPVELTVRNESGRERSFELVFTSGMPFWQGPEIESHHTVVVEAGATRTFALVVAMGRSTTWSQARLRVLGPGVSADEVSLFQRNLDVGGSENPGGPSSPFAMSESLAVPNWEAIAARLGTEGKANAGSRFLPASLPRDGRGYAGFRLLFMTRDEWAQEGADTRQAVMDWVSLGGRLVLVGASEEPRRHGFGTVASLGGAPAAERLAQVILDTPGWELVASRNTRYPWALPARLQPPEIARGRLLVFLIVVALGLGPVNLFVLARGRKRHRIYWTTPLLSLAASLGLASMILVQDGTGGEGLRFTAIAVMPGTNQSAVVQEQVVRTGLLLGDAFRSVDPLRMVRLPIEAAPDFNPSRPRIVNRGDRHVGWFQSRSREAQYLETTRPTRARVQVKGGATPQAVSSIDATLTDLFYFDGQGRVWQATNVAVGVPARLEQSDGFPAWWDERLQSAGPASREHLAPLKALPGYFYASAAAGGALETLPEVRWKQEALLYLGPTEALP